MTLGVSSPIHYLLTGQSAYTLGSEKSTALYILVCFIKVMAFLWLVPVLALIVLYLYHYRKTRSYVFQTVEKMYDGPKPVPFLGNALEFPLNSEGKSVTKLCKKNQKFSSKISGIFNTLMKYANRFERFYRLWLGPDVFIICYDPKDVEVSEHIKLNDSHILSKVQNSKKKIIILFADNPQQPNAYR